MKKLILTILAVLFISSLAFGISGEPRIQPWCERPMKIRIENPNGSGGKILISNSLFISSDYLQKRGVIKSKSPVSIEDLFRQILQIYFGKLFEPKLKK